MGIFPGAHGQLTPQSLVRFGLISNSSEMLCMFSYEEDPIKNEGARVFTTFSPLKLYGSYPLPWTPEFRSDLAQNLMQPFPHPNDGSDKISLRLANSLRRYLSSKMFTDTHTDTKTHTQTTARLVYYKLTFEPSAQVS